MCGVDKNASAAAVRVMAPPWIAETFRPAAPVTAGPVA
jgi:hypothetical protein